MPPTQYLPPLYTDESAEIKPYRTALLYWGTVHRFLPVRRKRPVYALAFGNKSYLECLWLSGLAEFYSVSPDSLTESYIVPSLNRNHPE